MSVKRGEIYFVNLNPVQGREQSGQRPVLVISSDAINQLPLVVTVVVGTKGENIRRDYPTNVRIAIRTKCSTFENSSSSACGSALSVRDKTQSQCPALRYRFSAAAP